MKIRRFSKSFLDNLTQQAILSARARQHANVHFSYQDPCQRLFNAIEVGSYIRPHRHQYEPRNEFFIAVRGLFTLVAFDDAGNVSEVVQFGEKAQGGVKHIELGAEVPAGIRHTVLADVPSSILFEVKAGPFNPTLPKEWAEWSPEEGSSEAGVYLANLREKIKGL